MMRIALGSDDVGRPLLDAVRAMLETYDDIAIDDLGMTGDPPGELYPDVAERVALSIKKGDHDRGILICGTGIGMAITACKVPGIRAALCHDTYSAERARKSNNAQIITMGARVIGAELANAIIAAWLRSEFDWNSHSAQNVRRIDEIEQRHLKPS